MIDSHNHLNDPRFAAQMDEIVARMRHEGVTGALVVGYDLPSSRVAVDLARRYPALLRSAVGIHPHDSKDLDTGTLAELRQLASCAEVVAFGEIGLDYYYDHSPREVQRDALCRQLALAAELGLPVMLHEREAADDLLTILTAEDGWARGGSWHCCNVPASMAVEIARRLHVGIAGWITFKKAEQIRALAQAVPLERLLLETDAPYLAPVPHRGRPNEPAYVRYTAQALAAVKGISLESVERVTTENALRAFPRWLQS